MQIGILGSGTVGQSLALGFAREGHTVKIGTRDPHKPELKTWLAQAPAGVSAGMFGDAALFAELALLCTSWSGTENAIWLADPKLLAGKIVIDVTNPLMTSAAGPALALGYTDSGGEQVQRWLPGARVVKCFNTVNAGLMYRPQLAGGPPTMPLCGDDNAARSVVAEIVQTFGWEPLDLGRLDAARLLEPIAMAWIRYGFMHNHWTHAWKLLGR